MRRTLATGILAMLVVSSTSGCFLNMYASDPIRRYRQLFFQSEDLRHMEDDIERFWMIDHASNLSLKRYEGMADPAARRKPN